MPYEPRYKPEDILNVLDFNKPANVSYISQNVGCSRDTVKLNLAQLERDGKAKRIETMGVKESLWIRCE
jgi:DeoR/GlpR family transcriptional regulator of sugar metabolism